MEIFSVILPNDNVFLVKDKKIVMFDTGTMNDRREIIKKFDENNIKLSDVSLIVISHSHFHNVANLHYFKNITKAPILIHCSEIHNLSIGQPFLNRIDNFGGFLASFAKREKKFQPIKPDIGYQEEFNLLPFGITGKVVHTPGHTSGSSSLFLSNDSVICGEVIIKKIFSKNPSFPYFIDNYDELSKSYLKIMNAYPVSIYSSHGGKISFSSAKRVLLKY